MIQYLIHFQDPLHAELTAANVKKLKIDILLRTSLDELNCGIARCEADLCGKLRMIVTARSLFQWRLWAKNLYIIPSNAEKKLALERKLKSDRNIKIVISFDIFLGRCWKIFKSGRVLVLEGSLILFFKFIIKLKKTSFFMQRYHRWLQLTAFSGVRWNRQYGIIKKQAVKLAGVAGYTKQILYFKNRYHK